jgi:hypothetical protein
MNLAVDGLPAGSPVTLACAMSSQAAPTALTNGYELRTAGSWSSWSAACLRARRRVSSSSLLDQRVDTRSADRRGLTRSEQLIAYWASLEGLLDWLVGRAEVLVRQVHGSDLSPMKLSDEVNDVGCGVRCQGSDERAFGRQQHRAHSHRRAVVRVDVAIRGPPPCSPDIAAGVGVDILCASDMRLVVAAPTEKGAW